VNVILIGAQGSGKGTQADLLAGELGLPHISSGDLFRKAMAEKTELGLKVKTYMDRGELVPDDLTVAMMLDRLAMPDCIAGVILDGFPRTVAQEQAFDEGLQKVGKQMDLAIYLEVPREELLARLSGRYICRANQHVYNVNTRPPKTPGVCDIDGSLLYQRPDDTGEAVQRRLNIFFSETIHLLDYFREQGKLIAVDGNQPIEQVRKTLLEAIRGR
jgi:adenylate kinase